MVKNPARSESKNDCASEGQHQITRPDQDSQLAVAVTGELIAVSMEAKESPLLDAAAKHD
jgi:hypothetical protein